MKKNLVKLFAITTASVYLLSGCIAATPAKNSDSENGKLNVTTSFYPLTYLVQEIGQDNVSITDLTPPSGSAHDAEISPAQIAKMEKSDAVFYLAKLSSAIDDAVANTKLEQKVNIAESVNLIPQSEIAAFSEALPSVDADSAHEHQHNHADADEHEHADDEDHHDASHEDAHDETNEYTHADGLADTDEHEHAEHEHEHEHEHAEHEHEYEHGDEDHHDHGIYDPHFWTDPSRLALAAPVVAQTLAKVDSAHEAEYEANAQKVTDKLNKLATDFKQDLATKQCRTNAFVVTHLAYGYLAAQNNLRQIGIASFDPDIEPSPARINQIKQAAEKYQIDTIFATSDTEKTVANAVAKETGTKVEILDPAATQRDPSKDYFDVMQQNFQLLEASLGCK